MAHTEDIFRNFTRGTGGVAVLPVPEPKGLTEVVPLVSGTETLRRYAAGALGLPAAQGTTARNDGHINTGAYFGTDEVAAGSCK